MSIVNKEILKLPDVLALPLSIPSYQRPYKWADRHANQLMGDLLDHMVQGKANYRLGMVVFHQDKGSKTLDIVDGQQRLLTLSLLSTYLDPAHTHGKPSLLIHEFDSALSIANLRHNAAHLKRRINSLSDTQKADLRAFFSNKCELVCVKLDDLSESFQFFDSQNARGKGLEPYDLLKAFHLREMRQQDRAAQTHCVERWERQVAPSSKATPGPSLHMLINDMLYPIRRWAANDSGLHFSARHVAVFKGINLQEHRYPHTQSLRATVCATALYNADAFRQWDGHQMDYPFQCDQTLLNGQQFFDYIAHYTQLYTTLFDDVNFQQKHSKFTEIMTVISHYDGRHRTGDGYVKKLFYCTLLFYFDKFGEHDFDRASLACFTWAYQLRLSKSSIRAESIDKHALDTGGLLRTIVKAIHPQQVLDFALSPITKIESSKTEGLHPFFNLPAAS